VRDKLKSQLKPMSVTRLRELLFARALFDQDKRNQLCRMGRLDVSLCSAWLRLDVINRSYALICCCSSVPFLLALALAQTPEPRIHREELADKSAPPTFHAESRLVVLDVVVTQHRHPVIGLAKSDFTVLEDGEPQQIQMFEAHVAPGPGARPQPQLPPHEYSNISSETPTSINIVLFDVLNTPLIDQPYVREQMVQFLKTLPPGHPVALFQLGSQLRMIAGFATPSDELIRAARKISPHASELLDTDEDRQQAAYQLEGMRQGSPNQEFFDKMQDFMAETLSGRDIDRAKVTLEAFSTLSRAVSGFRGRKNILWLAENFPVYFGPALTPPEANSTVRTYSDLTRDTAWALSSAQMSVYPIDVRGLAVGMAGAGAHEVSGIQQVQNIDQLHLAMDELASETGGHAYYDTNDLKNAMRLSIEGGSSYYTIAYAPRKQNWDSRYHHIRVRLSRRGLEAEYHKGYFAAPVQRASRDEAIANLFLAVQPASLQWTRLSLKAHVLPPDGEPGTVRIRWTLDPVDIFFADGPGNRKNARLELLTVAWDKNLKAAVKSSHTVELSLPPQILEKFMRTGLTLSEKLKLEPGTYDLRIGVMDASSGKIGTLDMPLQMTDLMNSKAK
jgi:VWFA-related protein